ncbi:polyprenyl synthetase family protein [Nocardia sp. JMUB6875]|uniref:polyprenyl synthetase family protein n=1 Tax=Nocardia sp. JMUB6875 TaxID=3158170 RepID=UPI0032E6117C
MALIHETTAAERLNRVQQILDRARRHYEPALRDAVYALPEPLRRMAGYHFGWWDEEGRRIVGDPGKGLRAALVLSTAVACGGMLEDAIQAAAAVEILHNFTLIHDDIMDHDRTRRGRATVWAVWGVPSAILLGDILHALAIRVVVDRYQEPLSSRIVLLLSAASIELCRGQQDDCAFETKRDVTVDQYRRMVSGKTGSLVGAACEIGAVCAHADGEIVSAMEAFGRHLGMAFQFADDILGIWGNPMITGKPVGNDVVRRKRSLPILACLNLNNAAAWQLRALFDTAEPIANSDVRTVASLLERCGARQIASDETQLELIRAIAMLPFGVTTDEILTLALGAANRVK